MQLAVLGDTKGNFAAFQAVIDAIAEEGIETIVHMGNTEFVETDINSLIELIKSTGVLALRGTGEARLVRLGRKRAQTASRMPRDAYEALCAVHDSLTSANLEFLRALPKCREWCVEGLTVVACHASPGASSAILDGDTGLARLRREREARLADLVLCGGAEDPFDRLVDGTFFAGPGKLAAAPGRARFAVLDTDLSPIRMDMRHVSY